MEAGPGWRAVSMGRQGRQVHQAGVQGKQDELSSGYEHIMRKPMNDDRSSFSLEAMQSTTIWRSRFSFTNYKDETAQHQQQLEHFSSLGHSQVHHGQSSSRFFNPVNSEKYSRNRLRRIRENQ
eukprot:3747715-Heterocapsa_arctica.AAC.1